MKTTIRDVELNLRIEPGQTVSFDQTAGGRMLLHEHGLCAAECWVSTVTYSAEPWLDGSFYNPVTDHTEVVLSVYAADLHTRGESVCCTPIRDPRAASAPTQE